MIEDTSDPVIAYGIVLCEDGRWLVEEAHDGVWGSKIGLGEVPLYRSMWDHLRVAAGCTSHGDAKAHWGVEVMTFGPAHRLGVALVTYAASVGYAHSLKLDETYFAEINKLCRDQKWDESLTCAARALKLTPTNLPSLRILPE